MKPKICPFCDSRIPENAPGGLCPACVLRDADEPPVSGRAAPSVEEIAAAFPQWEILSLVGQGGMGFVYTARQQNLDRVVALKILSPELSRDPAFAERFAREARTLGKLQHPNIVTVFEHGESGGFFYLLMEYVDGVNLRQAMRAGRFTPEQALAIVPGICDALQAAHSQGIWHRDIKPENILLDAHGGVKIADFGIARIVGDSERNFTLTMTGGVLGSAAYMAPEQHENPRGVDHRADIYSLGVVIYEMLTGELPLGRFPAPSKRAEVNARIDEIVFRTLEKERELRQQSADEVKTEVQGVGKVPRVSTPPPILRRRPRKVVAGLVALVLITVLGMIIHFYRFEKSPNIRANYDYQWSEATSSDAEKQILGWRLTLSEMNEPLRNYALGPLIEVVLPEPSADAPFMLNFENGNLFAHQELGQLLKSGGSSYTAPQSMDDWSYATKSWYSWLQIQKVNVLATMPDCDSIQFFATLPFPLTCKFEDADSDFVVRTIRERMDQNQPMETLVKHFKERSFIPLHSQFGQPFAFIAPEAFGATMGMVEVVGKSALPQRGVKIRYRLVKRMPDTPRSPESATPNFLTREQLRQLPIEGVIAEGLRNPTISFDPWEELKERAEAGKLSKADADRLFEGATAWLKQTFPDGYPDKDLLGWLPLENLRQRGLVTDERVLDFLQAFYAKPFIVPLKRIREGDVVNMDVTLHQEFYGQLLGHKLLNEMRSITVDGLPVVAQYRYGATGHSANREELKVELQTSHPAPGKHVIRCEMDSALVTVADAAKLDSQAPPQDWPPAKRQWKRTCDAELLVYAKDAEIVTLSDDPALNPVNSAELMAKPIIIRMQEGKRVAAVTLDHHAKSGVPYSLTMTLRLDGNEYPCGRFSFDGHGGYESEGQSKAAFVAAIGNLEPQAGEAEIVLSPDPGFIESSPYVEKIWGKEIVLGKVPLKRLDLFESGAGNQSLTSSDYPKLPNAQLIVVAMENPAESFPWTILKERAQSGRISATEADDLMLRLTAWLQRVYPDGCGEGLIPIYELLYVLHEKQLVVESRTMAFLQALLGNGQVTAAWTLKDQPMVIRFRCNMGTGGTVVRDSWFKLGVLRELGSVTIDGQPVAVRGGERRGMMNGAGYSGEIDVSSFAVGKHPVRFEIHSAIVPHADRAGLDDEAPSSEWPRVRHQWDSHIEAELTVHPDASPATLELKMKEAVKNAAKTEPGELRPSEPIQRLKSPAEKLSSPLEAEVKVAAPPEPSGASRTSPSLEATSNKEDTRPTIEARMEALENYRASQGMPARPQYRAECRVEVRLERGNTLALLHEVLDKFCNVTPVSGAAGQFDLVVTDPDPAQTSKFANYLGEKAQELLKEHEVHGTVKIIKRAERPEKPWMAEDDTK
ncbi:MAG: serine/threonine-protein kinase [Luteolibacter sp.]